MWKRAFTTSVVVVATYIYKQSYIYIYILAALSVTERERERKYVHMLVLHIYIAFSSLWDIWSFVGGLQLLFVINCYVNHKKQLQIKEHGLNLSESQQQGHSNTYNTPFSYLSRMQRIYPLKQSCCRLCLTGSHNNALPRCGPHCSCTVFGQSNKGDLWVRVSSLREAEKSRHFPAWILT